MFVLASALGQEAGRFNQSPMSNVLPSSECVLWILASSFAVTGVEGDTFCAAPASCLWHDLSQEVICAEIAEAGISDYSELLNDYKRNYYFFTVK